MSFEKKMMLAEFVNLASLNSKYILNKWQSDQIVIVFSGSCTLCGIHLTTSLNSWAF